MLSFLWGDIESCAPRPDDSGRTGNQLSYLAICPEKGGANIVFIFIPVHFLPFFSERLYLPVFEGL